MSTTTRLTIEQFDQMIADGVFEKGPRRERIELIEGELREMSSIGPVHNAIVRRLTRWSCEVLARANGEVGIQMSIELPNLESVLEPDVAWIRNSEDSYRRSMATDAMLIIEVADSSLGYDRREKCLRYSAAGIADHWVVDIPNRAIHVYRLPQPGGFASCQTFRGAERVSPLAAPEAELSVESLFPVDPGTEVDA